MSTVRVLVVDDEAGIRFGIRGFLETHGFQVDEADSCGRAEEVFRTTRPDAAILDYLLPDGSGLDLLRRLREIDPGVSLIILTAHGSIDLAVRAVKDGAEHFLTKPVELSALLVLLQRVLEHQRSRQKQLAVRTREARSAVDPFVGNGAAIRQLADQARRVAPSDSPILIEGETGSGKGVLAAWLHRNSPRADRALVDLNCAGLSRELLESELFGHERGAFTGAVASKIGLLEVAHRSTLFLDELGDMEPPIQGKLLKVLEEKRFRRVGDVRDRQVDIRLVAATHRNLAQLVESGQFRSDLYFRISTIPLTVPPLRQRAEDIPLLAKMLLADLAADLGRGGVALDGAAIRALQDYPWPGNIRELRNVLERALLLSEERVLGKDALRFSTARPSAAASDSDGLSLSDLERRHIERVLQQHRGRVEDAARVLGIPRSTLYQKIKRFGIVVSRI